MSLASEAQKTQTVTPQPKLKAKTVRIKALFLPKV